MTLTWNAVPGAGFYRVQRTSLHEVAAKTVATGLTATRFTEPSPGRGEWAAYTVIAVGQDGVSAGSEPVKVTVPARVTTP